MSKKRRINLRQTPRVSYYEPEEPNLDEYIFCSECGDYVYEYCSIHGPLLVIPDDKVPKNPDVPSYIPRAALTIPHVFLHLNYSRIPGAGLGVFTTLTLPRGVRFGPYKGSMSEEIKSSYCWQIRDANNRPCHVVDASDPSNSNWMRYVNCSRNWFEQNLVAYQYRGQIYYRTIKIIPRFTELMVFYGSEFACELGIDLKKYNSPTTYAQKLGTQKTSKHTNSTQLETANEDYQKLNNLKDVENDGKHQNVKKKTIEKNDQPKSEVAKNKKINSHNLHLPKTIKKSDMLTVQGSETTIDLNNNFSSNISGVCSVEPLSSESNRTEISKTNNNYYNRSVITKYTCDICSFITHRKVSLENHLLLHANVKNVAIFKCKYCSHVCKTESSIKYHELSHTGDKPYTCDVCQRKFSQSSHLVRHKRTHTGEKPYTCDVCQLKFSRIGNLVRHERIHTDEKPYTCDVCQRKYSDSSNLVTHKRIHTGEKPYTCDICQRKFSHSNGLVTHKRTHTGEKPYTCDVCQRKFSRIGNLVTHKRTHTGEKPYTCDVCQRKFSHNCNLVTHKRTHTGDKPYTCDVCQCKFSNSSDLVKHKRTHTGEKPYTCDICQRKFSHSNALVTHKRTHTGEKPYTCDVCQRKFSHSNGLVTHKRTHTGEKPYTCDVCQRKFSQIGPLVTHKRTHTGEKPYTCDVCQRKFSRSSVLVTHKRTHRYNIINDNK